jgi:colanic acid biosynthesis glycosyl transferase WcaI
MARFLFVAINYWPEPSGTAPYTTRIAEHLAKQGHDVTVLTGYPHYPEWKISSAYPLRLSCREVINGVRVIRKRHFVPGRQTVVGRALYESTFLAHGLATRLRRPDAVIGVIPSLNGGALARMLAARFRVGYAVIVQDLMGRAAGQSGVSGGSRVAGAISRAEAWSLRRARLVAPVSVAFIPYLKSLGISDAQLVDLPNWTLHSVAAVDRVEVRRRRLRWRDEQVVLHAGNMGLKQGLEQVLVAAKMAVLAAPHVRFVLLGDGSQRAVLEAASAGLPNVQFLPTQSADDYARALAAADVLLLSERGTSVDMSLPSKLTAYCAADRPIVAAVREGGATWAEVAGIGAGLLVPSGDPDALLGALARLRGDPVLADELGSRGLAYAQEMYSEEAALVRAEELVERLLRSGRRAETVKMTETAL